MLTPRNLATQWAAFSKIQRPAIVVLLVDSSLRFLPPISGPCRFVLPESHRGLAVDERINQVVDLEYPCGLTDVHRAMGLGQTKRLDSQQLHVVVRDPPEPELAIRADGSATPAWDAWRRDMAETVPRLAGQLNGTYPTLPDLAVQIPSDDPWAAEMLRRLQMMKLIKPRTSTRDGDMQRGLRQPLTIAGTRAPRAASFLRTGFAANFAEALLLAELVSAKSPAVKLTLAAVASALRVGISNILGRGSNTPSPNLRGPGAQLRHKGRLWTALGVLAGAPATPPGPNADLRTPFDEFQHRFAEITEAVDWKSLSPVLPERLSDEEVLAVEMAIVSAWLQNLAFISHPTGSISYAVEAISGQQFWYPEAQALEAHPDHRFAVRFGLCKNGANYATDTLTLVSNDAVLDVLMGLFPAGPDGEMPDYMALLKNSHGE